MADENGIVSKNEIDLFFRSSFSDEKVRRECIALLADAIEYAHQKGNSVWSICLRQDKRISLNVGRCLVMRVGNEYVRVFIDTRALTAETRRVVKSLSRPYAELKVLDDTESLEIPSNQLKQIFPAIRPSFLSLVDRAAETVTLRTSYYKNHQLVLVDYIGAALGRKLPQPNYSSLADNAHNESGEPNENDSNRRTIWKIAPGRGARAWEMCRSNNCIVIGWQELKDRDFREFSSKQEIEQALQGVGLKTGGAVSIWSFVQEITPESLVVANDGLTDVVGIGIVRSDYIPPNYAQNPSKDSTMPHARRVDWRITKPVHVDFQFGQQTVAPVKTEQWQKIKQAYAEQHPELLPEIEKLERGVFSQGISSQQDNLRQVQELLEITKNTRNIILYGPPGTGKTYNLQKFRDAFLATQLRKPISVQEQHLALVAELNWYETIALAMNLGAPKTHFRVQELLQSEPIQLMMQFKQREKNVANTLWSYLQTHTSPDVATVRFANRREPFLFAKTEASEWYLSAEGKEWVNDNLAQIIQAWRNPSSQQIDISQYCDFVTFHQSFAYEEFVEGLKPQEPDDDAAFVQYRVLPGVFKKICERAARDPDNNYLLIIDEINRANISKVFGELITLIEDDKRIGATNELRVRLPYSQQEFSVPPNLYLLGTMNTADRSIALLDIALRRRFTFVEMMPQPDLVSENVAGVNLRALLTRVNQRITALLDRDHQLGHSYLMNLQNVDELRFAWYHRVVPLLQEYFYNDDQRLRAVLGKAFFEKRTEQAVWDDGAPEMLDTETEHYNLRRFENDDTAFLDALRQMYGE